MTNITDKANTVLEALRKNVEGTKTINGQNWGIVYLDNAQNSNISKHEFAGYLSALTSAGLYESIWGDNHFGYVKL